jgi:hypothetical protein
MTGTNVALDALRSDANRWARQPMSLPGPLARSANWA